MINVVGWSRQMQEETLSEAGVQVPGEGGGGVLSEVRRQQGGGAQGAEQDETQAGGKSKKTSERKTEAIEEPETTSGFESVVKFSLLKHNTWKVRMKNRKFKS